MYIIPTDPFSRKTFDIGNILKRRSCKLLIAYDGYLAIQTIIQALCTSKILKYIFLLINIFDINKLKKLYKKVV